MNIKILDLNNSGYRFVGMSECCCGEMFNLILASQCGIQKMTLYGVSLMVNGVPLNSCPFRDCKKDIGIEVVSLLGEEGSALNQ